MTLQYRSLLSSLLGPALGRRRDLSGGPPRFAPCDGGEVAIFPVTFGRQGGGRGILVKPAGKGPFPAILYCHAHGNRHDIGAAELTDGRPSLLSPLGPVFARAGYVTFAVDLRCFGLRANEPESATAKAMLWRGETLMGDMLADLAAARRWLAAQPYVDARWIGAFGISMGATHAYMLAALDESIAAVAHLLAFADIEALIASGSHDLHGPYMTVPGLARQLPSGRIAGLIAPRPQFVGVGYADPLTPEPAVAIALDQLREAYRRDGAEDRLVVHAEPGGGHRETAAMRAAVLAFFDGALR